MFVDKFRTIISLFLGYIGYMILFGLFLICSDRYVLVVLFYPLVYILLSFLYGWFMSRYTKNMWNTVLLNFASYVLYWLSSFGIAMIREGAYGSYVLTDCIFGAEVLIVTLFASKLSLAAHSNKERKP
ncbi:MAG TPA: hypothetical protein DCY75_10550 [Clostridiales bacterium]|nr:hypothetical protein [Clostridiales bacterium]